MGDSLRFACGMCGGTEGNHEPTCKLHPAVDVDVTAPPVVPIRPGVPIAGKADPSNFEYVIEDLRRLLSRAERGEIDGIAYAYTEPNGDASTGWAGGYDTRDKLGLGVLVLGYRYAKAAVDKAERGDAE